MPKKNDKDVFFALRPKERESVENLSAEQKLTKNLQKRIFKAFSESLIEYGTEKAKEYYPVWTEQWNNWKKKVRNWYRNL